MSLMSLIDDSISSAVVSQPPADNVVAGGFPATVTASDVREFVQYLRMKPEGVVAVEELDRAKKRLFDERKLAAYQNLGLTTQYGTVVRLSPMGWRFARNFEFDAQAFRSILTRSTSCWSALHWMSDQNSDMVTSPEVIGYWLKFHGEGFETFDDEQSKGCVVSFFSLCQGAGLGTMTLGKRGHITRFCVDRVELKRFLGGDDSAPGSSIEFESYQSTSTAAKFKVLIHSCDVEIGDVLQRTFELVELDSERVELGWDDVISRKLSINDKCALVLVIGDDCFNDVSRRSIDERVLLGLGAAHVLFDSRVIVLAKKTDLVLEKLCHLKCYEFDGDQLIWNTGLEIVRELKEMRQSCFGG